MIDYRKHATDLIETCSNLQKDVLVKHMEAVLEEFHTILQRLQAEKKALVEENKNLREGIKWYEENAFLP